MGLERFPGPGFYCIFIEDELRYYREAVHGGGDCIVKVQQGSVA